MRSWIRSARHLKNFLLAFTMLSMGMVASCGDGTTGPGGGEGGWQIVGTWDACRVTYGEITIDLHHGNIYWYIDETGHFCAKNRLAFGYVTTGCGAVGAHRILQELSYDDTNCSWRLSLSADSDTLFADIIATDGQAPDAWVFARCDSTLAGDCFCDQGP